MADALNAGDVFQVAVQIEDNAARLYGHAAEQAEGERADVLRQLADMEREHKRIFEEMRDGTEARPGGAAPDAGQYLAAVRAGFGVEGTAGVAGEMEGKSMAEILDLAMRLEKEAILFYLGMRDTVTDETARETLLKVIGEERSHIVQLAQQKAAL